MNSKVPGNLLATAMAEKPHADVGCTLEIALSLNVPFWPQLPHYSYHEDMTAFFGIFTGPGLTLWGSSRTAPMMLQSFSFYSKTMSTSTREISA
jgi:hypothetical protein